MRSYLLRLIILLAFLLTICCLLMMGIGHGFSNTIIAYTEYCDDGTGTFRSKIYVADWHPGSGLRVALPEETIPLSPAWSPDGQKLAYGVDNGGPYEIYIREIKNGPAYKLPADTQMLNMSPSWSPNGHSIAFFAGGQVGVYDTLTGQIQNFSVYIANNVYPDAWSPDGNLLAVNGYYPNQRGELYILNITSGEIRDLSQGQFDQVGYPAWSPDGRYVTFNALKGAYNALYRIDLGTNQLLQFPKDDPKTTYISSVWSSDGQTIAAATITIDGRSEVQFFTPDGSLIRKILPGQQNPNMGAGEYQIRWTPDDRYLLLYIPVNAAWGWGNYAYELTTGEMHGLTPEICQHSPVAWRPDVSG